MHEAQGHDANVFVTLTYSDDAVPKWGSLVKSDVQDFVRRMRDAGETLRYFAVGEYGERTLRPHYHALLFGMDFPDKRAWRKSGEYQVFRSAKLEKYWPHGLSEVGHVSWESASYVARYCLKKVTGKRADEHYAVVDLETGEVGSRVPEFAVMSRRPGIGKAWLEKFGSDTYPAGSVVVNGRLQGSTRYYDEKYAELEPAAVESAKLARWRARKRSDETEVRMEVREAVAKARVTLKRRDVV